MGLTSCPKYFGDACQHVAHLLGREELATRLARIAGIHLHQIFVGIAEGVDLVVFEVLAKLHVAHRDEHVGKELVAQRHGVAQLGIVDREVAEESAHVIFGGCAFGRAFDVVEDVVEGDVQVLVLFGMTCHILE